MELLYTTQFSVPASQIAILLFMSTLALLFGRTKLALLFNYVFTLYWGFFMNRDFILSSMEKMEYFIYLYLAFGLAIILLSMIGFLTQK